MIIFYKVVGLFFVSGAMAIGVGIISMKLTHRRRLKRMKFTELHKLRLRAMR